MNKDICDLTVAEREAVANVFILVRERMIKTYDTPHYIPYICVNITNLYSHKLHRNNALAIINLRIDYYDQYDSTASEKTVRSWLYNSANITTEQRNRVYCTPCLQHEYRIAWLTSLINECLGLPFDTCYIESI